MRTQTTDNQILQLLTERDESALSIIEREYGRLCRKISLDILSNQQDAEECCNDALMRVWNSIPPTRPDSLRAYLVTIVRHLSIDRYKAGKAKCRDDSRMAEAISELDHALASKDDVEHTVAQRQLIAAAEAFIRSLPQEQGKIFLMRYYQMLTRLDMEMVLLNEDMQSIIEKRGISFAKYNSEHINLFRKASTFSEKIRAIMQKKILNEKGEVFSDAKAEAEEFLKKREL